MLINQPCQHLHQCIQRFSQEQMQIPTWSSWCNHWGLGPTACQDQNLPSQQLQQQHSFLRKMTETYTYLIHTLVKRDLSFINLSWQGCDVGRNQDDYFKSNPQPAGKGLLPGYEPIKQFSSIIKYPSSKMQLMVNHGYTVAEANELVRTGQIDLIAFAWLFIYNLVCASYLAVELMLTPTRT